MDYVYLHLKQTVVLEIDVNGAMAGYEHGHTSFSKSGAAFGELTYFDFPIS